MGEPTPEHTVLARYVRAVADRLGLRDVAVQVGFEPPRVGVAECVTTDGRAVVHLRFVADFHTLSPEERRYQVTHELLHTHFARAAGVLGDLRPLLSPEVADLAWANFVRLTEIAVDTLAVALAPLMPLA